MDQKTSKSIQNKVDNLLSKMTLEEKIGQLNQQGTSIYDDHLDIKEGMIREGKVGSFLSVNGVELLNKLQHVAVEESRLGIPLLFGHDVIHGYETIFPIPLAQACSWEPELAEKSSEIAACECSFAGIHWTFAPMLDIARDPRWGRIAEGYGEDTYLSCKMGAASVRGFQGKDLTDPRHVAACAKHFAAYGAAVGGRDYNTVDLSKETLFEVYLPTFKAALDAGAATFMSAFNDINGVPCTGNEFLLRNTLKKKWKFNGMVVSDAGAVNELVIHGYAEDRKDAARKAINAGVDMDMGSNCYAEMLKSLVEEGKVKEEILDDAVRRVLTLKFRLGLFDHPYTDTTGKEKFTLCKDFRNTARNAAKRSIVLLKNENNVLPLRKKAVKIAVVGPLANDCVNPLGCWVINPDVKHAVTVIEGIKSAIASDSKLIFAKGCDYDGNDVSGFEEAVKAAEQADVVVAAVGEHKEMSGEMHCRSQIGLPGVQNELLEKLKAVGKPLVVLVMSGRPLAIEWAAKNADAILQTWHLGIESGNAIADVLFGDYNPGGKLSVTIPYSSGQVPFYYNHPNTGRPADDNIPWSSKYLDLPIKPLYPFGYGLSYTKFHYSGLNLDKDEIPPDGTVKISADITNAGNLAGEEVVQLYVSDVCASRVRPVKELKGFQKIRLEPGETKTVSFVLNAQALGFYNEKLKYIVEPGKFKVWVGTNSDEGLEGQFRVTD